MQLTLDPHYTLWPHHLFTVPTTHPCLSHILRPQHTPGPPSTRCVDPTCPRYLQYTSRPPPCFSFACKHCGSLPLTQSPRSCVPSSRPAVLCPQSASDGFWKSVATRVPKEPPEIRILNPYFIQEAAFTLIGLPFNNGLMGRGVRG